MVILRTDLYSHDRTALIMTANEPKRFDSGKDDRSECVFQGCPKSLMSGYRGRVGGRDGDDGRTQELTVEAVVSGRFS
jgi:hypothetical protein